MKILMIAPQPFYTERGTPMNVKLMCQVLGTAGHRVDLLVFPTGENLTLPNVEIIRIPNFFRVREIPIGPSLIKLVYDFFLMVFTLLLCLRKRYDAVHGIEEGGFLAVGAGKIFRSASIFDMDSCISDQLQYSGFITNSLLLSMVILAEKWALLNASIVITVCEALSRKAKLIAPHSRIAQIEDIPLQQMVNGKEQNIDLGIIADSYGLSNARRVLYTGNLEPYQGIDFLLEAWKYMTSMKTPEENYKLIIVGGKAEQIEQYCKICEKLGLIDSVCWIGQRPSNEMSAWMNFSHVLVSPRTEGENTPLKIYSYMASERPIVATQKKTHTQVLDNTNAFMADPEPGAFAQAIQSALNDKQLAKEKAQAARIIVDKMYSFKAFKQKLLNAYQMAL